MIDDLKFYMRLGLRWIWLFLLVAGLIGGAAVALAFSLPTTYSASALLLVESEQIPGELASSTVRTDAAEQLEVIERRLMTRANLIDIARALDVVGDIGGMNPDEVVGMMRARTTISTSSGRNRATLMSISFNHGEARTSAAVVNEYITRILEANVELRRGQAQDTLAFFEAQVERLGVDLDAQSARILEFKNANSDALPDSLDYRLGRQSLLQERLAQIEREQAALLEQRDRLVDMFEVTGRLSAPTTERLTADEAQLNRLQDELSGLLAVYSEQNPQVRVLRARIKTLQTRIGALPIVDATDGGDVEASLLDIQLAEIDARAEVLTEQRTQVEQELSALRDTVERTPANAITLDALQRDYENIQAQYNQAVDGAAKAATGERIELLSKGQRIAVIEQASVPTEPASPNRPLIAGGGIVLGTGTGFGLVGLIVLLNSTVRRPADLERRFGIQPLGTLPYIRTRGELLRRRVAVSGVLAGSAALVVGGLFYVDREITPLVLVAERVFTQLGL